MEHVMEAQNHSTVADKERGKDKRLWLVSQNVL